MIREEKNVINRAELRGLMAKKGINQTELANIIGISTNSFNMKLNNKYQFTELEIKLIADCLKVDVGFLFTH